MFASMVLNIKVGRFSKNVFASTKKRERI